MVFVEDGCIYYYIDSNKLHDKQKLLIWSLSQQTLDFARMTLLNPNLI